MSNPIEHVFITAEIGINHNGDMGIAKKLIDWAALSGCDAVKFQKRTVDRVYTKEYLESYRERRGWNSARRSMTRSTATAKKRASSGSPPPGIPIPRSFCASTT